MHARTMSTMMMLKSSHSEVINLYYESERLQVMILPLVNFEKRRSIGMLALLVLRLAGVNFQMLNCLGH